MGSRKMQKAALLTREAHQALLDLKKIAHTAINLESCLGHGSVKIRRSYRFSDNAQGCQRVFLLQTAHCLTHGLQFSPMCLQGNRGRFAPRTRR
jgi:hypothetical protein